MAAQQGQGNAAAPSGPPYRPQNQSLGGTPDILPDIPICVVFLVIYLIFAAIHMTILQKNKKRAHKFIFSGAIFGFCAIRLCTMALRIAWACERTNVRVGIAAQIFVYVGTVILFITNWFFTQRVIRAQHPHWGWSKPYRIFHLAFLVGLLLCLLLLIVAAIQMFYTESAHIHKIDRDLQLTGLTYFVAFSFAPVVLVLISLVLPRKGIDKFGAGRMRNNIVILLIASIVLTLGTAFRAGTNWLAPVPLRSPSPWYFSKACFYCFNFVTEIVVIVFYALVRVDLRFHVPDGAKGPGSYSQVNVNILGDEKNLKRLGSGSYRPMLPPNNSTETLETYRSSVFDDSRTLADSLRYPSSTLELDSRTGNWKIKRSSRSSVSESMRSVRFSEGSSPSSIWSPESDNNDVPPVPDIPNWPLRDSQQPPAYHYHSGHTTLIPSGIISQEIISSKGSNEIPEHGFNHTDLSNHLDNTMAALEFNSTANRQARAFREANFATTGPRTRLPPALKTEKVRSPVYDKRKTAQARLQKMDSTSTDKSWTEGDDKRSLSSKYFSAPAYAQAVPGHHCTGCTCSLDVSGPSGSSTPISKPRSPLSEIVERGRTVARGSGRRESSL